MTIAAMFILSSALLRTGTIEAFASSLLERAATRPAARVGAMLGSTVAASALIKGFESMAAIALIVEAFGPLLQGAHPLLLLIGLYALTSLLTECVTNMVTVTLTPLAVATLRRQRARHGHTAQGDLECIYFRN